MLRDLAVVLSLVLTGAVVASACSTREDCADCCDFCGGGTSEGSSANCASTEIQPVDAGPSCTENHKPAVICTPGSTQPCRSLTMGAAMPTCVAGLQTCNADGTGFSVCDDVLPHPDDCDEASSWSCDGEPLSCGSATWATSIAGAGDEAARSIAVDALGNSVVAIAANGGDVTIGTTTLTFASPGQLVAKFDPSGAPLWAVALVNATTAAVTTDETGATYVTGTSTGALDIAEQPVPTGSSSGAYLAKLSPAGALVWAHSLEQPQREDPPASSFSPAAVAIAQGAPVIVGSYSSLVTLDGITLPGAAGLLGFVARYDPMTGLAVWAIQLSGSGDDRMTAVAGDDAGEIVVGGYSDGTPACPTPHLVYARLGGDGAIEWFQQLDTPARITSIKLSGDFVVAAGVAARPAKVQSTTVDAAGFVFALEGTAVDWWVPTTFGVEGVVLDAAGDIVAAGTTSHGEAAMLKLDLVSQRFYEHVYAAHPNGDATSASIAIHALGYAPDDGVIVAGAIRGASDLALGFGGVPVASTTGLDAFVARLAP